MLRELQEHNIAPFMTFQQDDKTVIPLFTSQRIAERFGKRNTPREWCIGTFPVTQAELDQFADLGWETQIWDYPKKREITVEVVELKRPIETRNAGFKRHIK